MVYALYDAAALAIRCSRSVVEASVDCPRCGAMLSRQNPLRCDECAPTAALIDLPWPTALCSGASTDDRHVDIIGHRTWSITLLATTSNQFRPVEAAPPCNASTG